MPVQGGGNGLGGRNAGFTIRYSGVSQGLPCRPLARRVPAYIPASTLFLVNNANTTVVDLGNNQWSVTKNSGSGSAYNASAISTGYFSGDFAFGARRVSTVESFYIGASANPTAANDDNIDFTIAYDAPSAKYYIFEGLTYSGVGVIDDAGGTLFPWIWRTGSTIGYGIAATLAEAQAAPARTVGGVTADLYFDSSLKGPTDELVISLAGVATVSIVTLSMAADVGTFSFTGQDANLTLGRNMPGALGTFSYSGQAANLLRGYNMAAAQATFSYTGQAAGTSAAYSMTAGQATFSYSGQDALLERGYSMPAGLASYSYNGQPAILSPGYGMPAGLGAFTYTGQDAALRVVASLAAAFGAFSYTGQNARALLNMEEFPVGGGGAPPQPRVSVVFFR